MDSDSNLLRPCSHCIRYTERIYTSHFITENFENMYIKDSHALKLIILVLDQRALLNGIDFFLFDINTWRMQGPPVHWVPLLWFASPTLLSVNILKTAESALVFGLSLTMDFEEHHIEVVLDTEHHGSSLKWLRNGYSLYSTLIWDYFKNKYIMVFQTLKTDVSENNHLQNFSNMPVSLVQNEWHNVLGT